MLTGCAEHLSQVCAGKLSTSFKKVPRTLLSGGLMVDLNSGPYFLQEEKQPGAPGLVPLHKPGHTCPL